MGRSFIAFIAFLFVISMAHSHLLSPSLLSETHQAGKKSTPWPCCDNCSACIETLPLKCWCLDLVPSCHPKCKNCVESDHSTADTPLFRCMDLITDYCEFKCGASILDH